MIKIALIPSLAALSLALLTGCTSVSSNYSGEIKKVNSARLIVCHGFDCRNKTKLGLTSADSGRFSAIMARGRGSAKAERAAISAAVRYFEDRSGQAIGVRDTAKSTIAQSGRMGQMDCIDESTNTRSLLLYLENRGLLKHHKVLSNVSRGFFADGRYPHSTAVVREKSGTKWAVDSWYEPMGGAPDIMPLAEWQSRGVMGER